MSDTLEPMADGMADELAREAATVLGLARATDPDVFGALMGDTGEGSCPWCGEDRNRPIVRPGEPEPGVLLALLQGERAALCHSDARVGEVREALSRAEDALTERTDQLARAEARARAWAAVAGGYAGRLGIEPECLSEHACPVERREYREAWDRGRGSADGGGT